MKVRIKKDVPVTIFDEPTLAKQVANLFNGAEEKMKARVNEIVKFLDMDSTDELSYDNIAVLFKGYFFKLILNEAVEITFSEQGNYDILSNILSLLSEEKMETAIMGEPMIDAFSKAIRSIPNDSGLSAALHGGKILLLEKEFLGKTIFPTLGKKKKNEQNNYSGECGCSCTCDGGCEGDTSKCTSKKAIERGCNHCSICYTGPMSKNIQRVTVKINAKENTEDYSAKTLLEKVIEESDSQIYRGDNIGSRD